MIYGMVHSVIASGAFLMTFLNSLWPEVISEHISSINSLENISFIFHGNALAISGKNLFENCSDYFSGDQ